MDRRRKPRNWTFRPRLPERRRAPAAGGGREAPDAASGGGAPRAVKEEAEGARRLELSCDPADFLEQAGTVAASLVFAEATDGNRRVHGHGGKQTDDVAGRRTLVARGHKPRRTCRGRVRHPTHSHDGVEAAWRLAQPPAATRRNTRPSATESWAHRAAACAWRRCGAPLHASAGRRCERSLVSARAAAMSSCDRRIQYNPLVHARRAGSA